MKRSRMHRIIWTAVLIGLVGTISAWASPYQSDTHIQSFLSLGASSNVESSIFKGGPKLLSVGVVYEQQKRGMIAEGNAVGEPEFAIDRLMGLVGLDVLPWVTVEGGIGYTELEIEEDLEDRERDWEWRVGGRARLMDYKFRAEEAYYFRLEAESRFSGSQSENGYSDVDWTEFYAALLAHLTSRPLIHFGDDIRTVSLYGGPALSWIEGTWDAEGASVDFHEDESFGGVIGISANPDDFMTLKIEAVFFDDVTWSAGLSLHF